MTRAKLLRSVLFCPADREKILAKSLTVRPDAFVFDLEDAVSAVSKAKARDILANFLTKDFNSAATCTVRVNCPMQTQWGKDDIRTIASIPQVQAIVLPKVDNVAVIEQSLQSIRSARNDNIAIWAMIETPRGVLNSASIAGHSSVECLVFGSNDLTKELRAMHTPAREPLLFSMSKCILAARSELKRVVDGVYMDINDLDGLAKVSKQGRDLGFDGKSIIHPSHIDTVNAAFSPSSDDVAWAKKVLTAWEKKGDGVSLAVVDGKLVEELHVREAEQIIEFAKSSNLL
jgi:citrate lyase beta subunit